MGDDSPREALGQLQSCDVRLDGSPLGDKYGYKGNGLMSILDNLDAYLGHRMIVLEDN